jgi:predicted amidohydrolase YtcJ
VKTLFAGGTVRVGRALKAAEWVLIDGPRIVAAGSGATLIPAFCDAHVHLPATGLYLAGMDFRGERSAAAIAAAFAARARAGAGVLFGGNFEDPLDEPLERGHLDAAVGERAALLARADMHSCVVSTALLDALDVDGLQGVDRDVRGQPTGYLRDQAAAEAWRWFDANLPARQQRTAVERAIEHALAQGVCAVHEMHVVEWRGWASLEVTLEAARAAALEVVPYVATSDLERVVALGLDRIGGDYFLDGSFGSHTAWMRDPYDAPPPAGTPPTGIGYRSDAEVLELFTRAQERGLQVGVHAIGDAAIEQALRAWETVARCVGLTPVRAGGHRIEHFECASVDHMRRAASLGLRASVQPAFDRFWGGGDGMYARRVGARRALAMNRFASMLGHGLVLGAGSDSTVTPLDPRLQMASLRTHHRPDERLDARAALVAHTAGAHALAGERDRGVIESGGRADFALLDRDPLAVDAEELLATQVLQTWIGGRRVWPGVHP